jgi:hypothetical protein
VRENFIVRVEDRTPFGVDNLLVNVFFGRQPSILVVLDHLKVNKPKGEGAKERDKREANQRTTTSSS